MRLIMPNCPECGETAKGTLEAISGCAILTFDEDGVAEHGDETEVFWNGQKTVCDGAGRITLICPNSHEWPSATDKPSVAFIPDDRWHPIETAPKPRDPDSDWVRADIWAVSWVHTEGRRYADSSLRADGKWYDSGGNPIEWEKTDDDGTLMFCRITHWRPLCPPES